MAISKSASATTYAPSGSSAWTVKAQFTENSVNVANNTSNITVKATFSSSSGSFSSGTSDTLKIYWHDNKTNSDKQVSSKSVKSISAGGSISCSGTIDVTHKDDGTLSGYAKAVWTKNDGNSWTPASKSVSTANTALTPIARESTPTMSAASYNVDSTITIKTNRKVSSYTHTVSLRAGNLSVQIGTAKAVGDSVTFTPNANQIASIMAAIPNATTLTAIVTVTTYTGSSGSQVGSSKTCTFTYKVPNTYKPTLSNWSISETAIPNIVINAGDVVKGISKKNVSISVTGKNSATISKVTVANGNKSFTMTGSGGTYSVSMSGLTSGTFTVTATDSRGFSNTYSVTYTFYDYDGVRIESVTFERDNATSNDGSLTVIVDYYEGQIGNISNNTVTAKYKLNTQSTQNILGTSTGESPVTFEDDELTGLIYTDSFTCDVEVTDSLEQTATYKAILNGSDVLLWLGKETARCKHYWIFEDYIGMYDSNGDLHFIDGDMFARLLYDDADMP